MRERLIAARGPKKKKNPKNFFPSYLDRQVELLPQRRAKLPNRLLQAHAPRPTAQCPRQRRAERRGATHQLEIPRHQRRGAGVPDLDGDDRAGGRARRPGRGLGERRAVDLRHGTGSHGIFLEGLEDARQRAAERGLDGGDRRLRRMPRRIRLQSSESAAHVRREEVAARRRPLAPLDEGRPGGGERRGQQGAPGLEDRRRGGRSAAAVPFRDLRERAGERERRQRRGEEEGQEQGPAAGRGLLRERREEAGEGGRERGEPQAGQGRGGRRARRAGRDAGPSSAEERLVVANVFPPLLHLEAGGDAGAEASAAPGCREQQGRGHGGGELFVRERGGRAELLELLKLEVLLLLSCPCEGGSGSRSGVGPHRCRSRRRDEPADAPCFRASARARRCRHRSRELGRGEAVDGRRLKRGILMRESSRNRPRGRRRRLLLERTRICALCPSQLVPCLPPSDGGR